VNSLLHLGSRVVKDLKRFDFATREAILAGLERFVTTGAGDVKRLKGHPSRLRLRIGDYRAIFTYMYADGKSMVMVEHVGHRKEVYRE